MHLRILLIVMINLLGARVAWSDPGGDTSNAEPQLCPTVQESFVGMLTFPVLRGIRQFSGLKSRDELEQYLRCHAGDANFDHFRARDEHNLEMASSICGVPYPYLACIAFREAKLNDRSGSSLGHGLLGMTVSGVEGVNEALRGNANVRSCWDRYVRVMNQEGKLHSLPEKMSVRDETSSVMNVIAGTALSLSLMDKFNRKMDGPDAEANAGGRVFPLSFLVRVAGGYNASIYVNEYKEGILECMKAGFKGKGACVTSASDSTEHRAKRSPARASHKRRR